MERATEAKRQNTLRRELEWIRRGCQARSTKQQARIDRFEDMKEASRQARAKFDKSLMDMSSVSRRLGRKTIELNNITKAYNGHTYINDFTYIFLRDDRIGIIGSNGCGKSTLMNNIIGQKIAITSNKPQTTRNRIQTVYTDERGQIVFVDTPGIHKAKNKLGEYMVGAAEKTINEVDVVCFIVEPTTYIGACEQHIIEKLKKVNAPKILVINKVDTVKKRGDTSCNRLL